MKVQRLRIRYAVTAEATTLGQRDIVESWEHACKAAAIPLAYSEGKRPSPHISVAAPLSQSVTSKCETLDLYLSEVCDPNDVIQRLARHLAPGIHPISVQEIGVNGPSLQSQVRLAEYRLTADGVDRRAVETAVERLMSARTFPAEYKREAKTREYDLRPLVLSICVTGAGDSTVVTMRLRAEAERTARADQVAIALGLPNDVRIERTALELDEVPSVILNHRRAGEPNE